MATDLSPGTPPLAWLLNLDADRELEDPARYRPSAEIERRILTLVPRMHLLLSQDDVILNTQSPLTAALRALAFCPTPRALGRIRQLGLDPPAAPPLEVLARANSRAFCAELGQTLAGARYVHDMADLEATLRGFSPTGDWLLKRPFAFAGRERRRAIGGELDASTRGFAERTFRRGQGLQVEPWVERRADFAQHGYLHRDGTLAVGPLVRQVCDALGRWERSELARPGDLEASHWQSLRASVEQAGEALFRIGYFGAFGVDAFTYLIEPEVLGFQPRSEINARFTMGYPRGLLMTALAHG